MFHFWSFWSYIVPLQAWIQEKFPDFPVLSNISPIFHNVSPIISFLNFAESFLWSSLSWIDIFCIIKLIFRRGILAAKVISQADWTTTPRVFFNHPIIILVPNAKAKGFNSWSTLPESYDAQGDADSTTLFSSDTLEVTYFQYVISWILCFISRNRYIYSYYSGGSFVLPLVWLALNTVPPDMIPLDEFIVCSITFFKLSTSLVKFSVRFFSRSLCLNFSVWRSTKFSSTSENNNNRNLIILDAEMFRKVLKQTNKGR